LLIDIKSAPFQVVRGLVISLVYLEGSISKKGGQSSFYIGRFMTARVTKRAVANNEINNYRLKARKRAGSHLFTSGDS